MKNKDVVIMLCDLQFLNNYKYVSKEEFLNFVKFHINDLLNKLDEDFIFEEDELDDFQKYVIDLIIDKKKWRAKILNNILTDKEIESLISKLVYEKLFNDSIDNIILLEEIEFSKIENLSKKLKLAYKFLLEFQIYNYIDLLNIEWKSKEQKVYVENKVKYSLIKQKSMKQQIAKTISEEDDIYSYNKKIGILASMPLRDLINCYDSKIMLDIYKIKYFITLESKLKKCSENKKMIEDIEIKTENYKNFSRYTLDKYEESMKELKKEIEILKKEKDNAMNEKNQKNDLINKYEAYIKNYNDMSIFKKIINALKNKEVKFLN